MEIRLLGPVEVRTDGVEVPLGGEKPQVLVGVLAMAANHAVHRDRLIDAMWGQHPPETAIRTLQSMISHVRHSAGAEIRREGHSYTLVVAPDHIDACRFERIVRAAAEAGDPQESVALCRDALDLWRGAPFGDLAELEVFGAEVRRLDELRLLAMELTFEGELALGHGTEVVGALEAATEEHPYDEKLWRLLILALAQQGRRVEALRAAADLRASLAAVGVTPAHELDELEEQILLDQLPSVAF